MEPIDDIPELEDPVLIAAFEGWTDAADAASNAVLHLIDALDAELIAELDSEDYYDYQATRPIVGRDIADPLHLDWPVTQVYAGRPEGWQRDVVLVVGVEPNLRWQTFVSGLLELAEQMRVSAVYCLGAMLADAPHSRPVPVTGQGVPQDLAVSINLEPADYTGPAGINVVLASQAADRGIDTLMLWAAVPHYLAEPPCPKATLALLTRLEDALRLPIPRGDLAEQSDAWQRGAEEAVAEDEQVAEYVESLEAQSDLDAFPGTTADDIARDFERFLRRRDAGS